jgi:hypothetical protein
MNFFKLFFFLIFSIDAMAVVIKCGSTDKSRLGAEINDMGTKAIITFSAVSPVGPVVVKTEAIKSYKGLQYNFTFNNEGTQAILKEDRSIGRMFKNRSGLKLNCKTSSKEITCSSTDRTMAVNFKNPIMEITDNIGQTNQSFVRIDSEVIYQTSMGMEVVFKQPGRATYSGNKRNGAIVDSSSILLMCK